MPRSIDNLKVRSFLALHRRALWLISAGFILYSFLIVYRYVHFAYNDWDMAYINHIFWSLIHGTRYSSLYDIKYPGGHVDFISIFISPALLAFPYPLTFTFILIACFMVSVWVFYLMAREDLEERQALLLAFLYTIFVPNLIALVHDHNTESLAPLFFMLLMFFYRRKRIAAFYITMFFFMILKENMPLIIAMFGLWGLFAKDRDRMRWGLIPLIVAVVYFPIAVVIMDANRMGSHPVWVRYSHLGASRGEIFLNLLKPTTWMNILLAPWNVSMVVSLFGIFLIPSLLSPGFLLLMAPVLGYHLLSNSYPEKTIYYNYALTMTPAIFLATVNTIKKLSLTRLRLIVLYGVLAGGCLFQYRLFAVPIAHKIGFSNTADISGKWRLVNQIPKDASVIATFEFLPALSLRKEFYSFHKVYRREFQELEQMRKSIFYTGKPFVAPDSIEYALINFDDEWIQASMQTDPLYASTKIREFLRGWREVDTSGTAKLYKRNVLKAVSP